MKNNSKVRKFKYLLDIFNMFFMIILMGYEITGDKWHEYLGIGLIISFVIHNFINLNWYRNIFKNFKKKVQNISGFIWIITNFLLVIDMLILAITSVCISKHVFFLLNINLGYIVVYLHTTSAYLGFIIMSVHTGCHWKMIMNGMKNMLGITSESRNRKFISRIAALIIAALGVYSSFERNIASKFKYDDYDKSIEQNVSEGITNNKKNINGENNNDENNNDENNNDENNNDENNSTKNNNLLRTNSMIDTNSVTLCASSNQSGDGNMSLEEYLKSLRCSGCGKHCLLTSPRCGKGERQASEATDEYYENINNQEIGDSKNDINDTNDTNDASESDNNENSEKDNNDKTMIIIPEDKETEDNIYSLLFDYMSISGLYIVGTYYILKIAKR